MELHGREVRLAFTTGAMQDIAQLCPGKDIRRLAEVFSADEDAPIDMGVIVKFAAILSEWGEEAYQWENPGYTPKPFSERELLAAKPAFLRDLFEEVMRVMREDGETTVETEPDKSPKNQTAQI